MTWEIYLGDDLVATTDNPDAAQEFREFEGMYRVTEKGDK